MATTTATPSARDEARNGPQSPCWQQRAACRKVPTAIFYPAGNHIRVAEEQAKGVCWLCPVRAACLVFALEHSEPYGVWGGLTAEERRMLAAAVPKNGEGAGHDGPSRPAGDG